MTEVARNALVFVSGVLALVACSPGGGGGTPSPPVPEVCAADLAPPPGFEPLERFEETYEDHVGTRAGFRNDAGQELHLFAGIPGEFGEGLPSAGELELGEGRVGRLAGGPHRVWVLVWEEGGVCDPRAVLGNGFGRRAFLQVLRETGLMPAVV